jgi:geranylgeranyl diphosphate synthase, type II
VGENASPSDGPYPGYSLSENDKDYLAAYFESNQVLVDLALNRYVPEKNGETTSIRRCMRHALEGGKRLRPILTLTVVSLLGDDRGRAIPTACAIELIHTHSLILDDLPCMDNDDLRRGRPTCHAAFGESTALLAADALLNLAIAILGHNHVQAAVPPGVALQIIHEVGESVGLSGVIGGQLMELSAPSRDWSADSLEQVHYGKTAALFRLSARAGALLAGADQTQLAALTEFAERTGLAFQIMDDLLDVTGDTMALGTADRANYALTFGVKAAEQRIRSLTADALKALSCFGDEARPLRLITVYNAGRSS